ncbi:MAG: Gfo/Idh/MocA family protein [Flavitalea sp.]
MENNRKIRWAILGAGKIAHKFASDFSVLNNAELVAVAARDKSRAKEFADKYKIPHYYNYEELYKSDLVDIVYVATTHNFHYEQTLACLQNKKGVLCEKPVTINDKEFKKLSEAAHENKTFLMEGLWTYFLPAFIKAKEWISEGKIGEIKSITADFGVPMEYEPKGRLYNPELAGGALLDLGIYPVALSTFFMERKPNTIKASGYMTNTGVDATTSMILDYGNVSAVLQTTMVAQTMNKGYIYGEKGYIEIQDYFKADQAILFNKSKEEMERFMDDRKTWGYNFEMQEATDCMAEGKIESEVVPHKTSNNLQEILTEIRNQIGLKYPME